MKLFNQRAIYRLQSEVTRDALDTLLGVLARILGFGAIAALFVFIVLGNMGKL